MARDNGGPEFLSLQRRQIDDRKGDTPGAPPAGWVRTIRTALGMTAAQLGARLGISQQGVTRLEKGEQSGTVTLATLARAASALGCELVVEFRPRTSLEQTIREQAMAKAQQERNRIVHTMRLEAQEHGVGETYDLEGAVREWTTTRLKQLWD